MNKCRLFFRKPSFYEMNSGNANFFIISDHGHKKFGRLWEQIIFPYDRLKTAYAHWHITPIQVVAELRDPNKLKKPKRPDLIQQPLALNLQYRHNAADFSEGSPGGYVTYGENSDDESVDSKSRLGLEFKVKQEPTESFEQTNVRLFFLHILTAFIVLNSQTWLRI